MNKPLATFAIAALLTVSCAPKHAKTTPAPVAKKPTYSGLSRDQFNFAAQEHYQPLFWRADANGNGAIDPDELAVLTGPWSELRSDYVDANGFTEKFGKAFSSLTAKPEDESKLPAEEKTRRELLRKELSQGKPTLVETDLSTGTPEERAIAEHLETAARLIEALYAEQKGTTGMAAKIPAGDSLSAAVFNRNQSPFCVAPKTEKEDACTALWPRPPRTVGLYPAEVQGDKEFCSKLEKEKNGPALMDHFSTVVSDGKAFKAVPYNVAYEPLMKQVASELDAAAAAVTSSSETAFKSYLTAAATSFRTNNWQPADEAWVAMGPQNSKWFLRVAPDEVYYEPCAWKAGFALQFARINPDSLAWQQKLEPVKGEMEKTLADFAGPPYKSRNVAFKLPDFIDVVLNAGDQRAPHGATVGQSLPNWGPVSEKGGRTVAMTNLYTDLDSRESLKNQMSSLYCKATMDQVTTDPKPQVMSTVLHEAAHNLGPAHDYAVKGKKDDAVFGGPLAATMEELKAQTSALFFAGWLADKQIITQQDATQAGLRDIAWAFGHISRGMYDAEGHPRNYSHLASIELGTAFKDGALFWKPQEKAANGTDTGCFEVDLPKWKTSVTALEKRVLAAKGKGDKKDAEKMKADFVDAKDAWAQMRDVIQERWLRAPKATFVYSVKTK
ncbi:MAG: hypothetical protein ACJ790_11865 [Myxococcaceae bacterium]